MKREDFLDLKINQVIFFKGEKKNIQALFYAIATNEYLIRFHDTEIGDSALIWKEIFADCSLEAQKQKRKFYQWKVKKMHDDYSWQRIPMYLDEEGKDTLDRDYYNDWHNFEKIKIENDFVEV